MTQQELIDLIDNKNRSACEATTLEFKAAQKGFPAIYDTLSSFSNQDSGGVIILGFDESTHSVCGIKNPSDFVKQIQNACAAMQPRLHVNVVHACVDNKDVLGIEVPGLPICQRPCYKFSDGVANGSYIRSGDGDIKMPAEMLHSYITYSNRIYPDSVPEYSSDISDLRTLSFQKYRIAVAEQKSLFAQQDDNLLLQNSGFISASKPTLAGLMLLADYPQKYFKNFYIAAAVYDSNTEKARLLDSEHIDGNIMTMLTSAIRFVKRNTRHMVTFDGAERVDVAQYPDIALRELILNALLHRDYDRFCDGRCINLMVCPDKVVIASPGLLYGSMTLDTIVQAGYTREIRNPSLVSGAELLMNTENRGTGIRVSRQAMLAMNLPEPKFVLDRKTNTFLVTLKSKIGRPVGEDSNYDDVSAVTSFFD